MNNNELNFYSIQGVICHIVPVHYCLKCMFIQKRSLHKLTICDPLCENQPYARGA